MNRDKSTSDEEALIYPKNTIMHLDLGYTGYKAANLTVILPHKTELTLVQKQQNTEHSSERVCDEHTMKRIKRLRIVKDTLRLNSYDYLIFYFKMLVLYIILGPKIPCVCACGHACE